MGLAVVIEQVHILPVPPHAVRCDRRRHLAQDFNEAQGSVVREWVVVTPFVHVANQVNVPSVGLGACVLNQIGQLQRPFVPAGRYSRDA